MDCTTTFRAGAEELTLHFDFTTLLALVQRHRLPLRQIDVRLRDYDVEAQSIVMLEGLEGGRRVTGAGGKPFTLAQAQSIVQAVGILEVTALLLNAIARATVRPKEGGDTDPEGKASTT